MKLVRPSQLTTLALALAFSWSCVCTAEAPPRRWAIISSKPVQKSNIAGLVFAALSQEDGIELVERDALATIADELRLSVLSANAQPGDRLRLGRLLRADLLMLLSFVQEDGKTMLKVSFSDCEHGARLRTETLSGIDEPVDVATDCQALAREVNTHFRNGIKHVVGVAPFNSKDLVHDYDHLQNGFSCLLQNALAAIPGVAVIDTEEAAAIRREFELAEGKVHRRVPLLVQGEYTVKRDDQRVAIQLSITIMSNGDEPVIVKPHPMSARDTANYVSIGLPRKLVGKLDSLEVFEPERQVKWFRDRAKSFSDVGAWEQAAGLLEAALLLRPDDTRLRLLVLGNYRRLAQRPLYEIGESDKTYGDPDGRRAFEMAVAKRVKHYKAGLAHLEYLIRNRRIKAWSAIKLADSFTGRSLLKAVPFFVRFEGNRYERMGGEQLKAATEAERAFFLKVYPLILRPHRGRLPPGEILEAWKNVITSVALFRIDRTYRDKNDLAFIQVILTKYLPHGGASSDEIQDFVRDGFRQRGYGRPTFSIDDWLTFLENLCICRNEMVQVYGRYGRLCYQWYLLKSGKDHKAMSELLFDADGLRVDFEMLEFGKGRWGVRSKEALHREITAIRTEVAATLGADGRRAHAPYKGTKGKGMKGFWVPPKPRPKKKKVAEPRARLHIQPVNCELLKLNGKREWLEAVALPNMRMLRPDLDVFWGAHEIRLMRRGDAMAQVLREKDVWFSDVRWDGERIWVATRNAGIWILSEDGVVLQKITRKDGLLPAGRELLLHPLGEGKVCAVGSFGEHERAWLAIVQADGKTAAVNVFHQATEIKAASESGLIGNNPKLVFRPTWIHDYDWGSGPGYLLIGRRNKYGTARFPIIVEVRNFSVWVHLRDLADTTSHTEDSFDSDHGRLLIASEHGVKCLDREGRNEEICHPTEKLAGCLLRHDGSIYVPGEQWFRIDPKDCRPEAVSVVLDKKKVFDNYAVSAHHGLIGWNVDGPLHKITVIDKR